MKMTHNGFTFAFLMSVFLLVACGGGGSNTPPTPTYTLSGQVRNIPSGAAFVLQNNGGDNITIPAGSTSFTFPAGVANGGNYHITVFTQPANPVQNCTISNGIGAVSVANVTDIIVDCSWIATDSLVITRSGHTATLLSNGKLLVSGGIHPASISTVELYDPNTGLWASTGALAITRAGHTATLLPNGKVLVAGGAINGNSVTYLASAELYDPNTGLWTSTGSLTHTRGSHTATLLPNGKVLVTGGIDANNQFIASAELYDPSTGLWTPTGSLANTRIAHTATLLPNGKVLVAGGHFPAVSAELYDPATGLWTTTGSLANARSFYTATLLPNGKVLVAGGATPTTTASAELYDPATGLWSATGSLANARSFHAATLLPNGKVLVTGGSNANNITIASTELYDPATGLWTQAPPLTTARNAHTATLLLNSKVLVTGGTDGATYLNSAELYY